MLTLHQASTQKRGQRPKIGLAIAGGGPLGAIYELGALRALDESIQGLKLHHLDVYVGVSAGAFLASSLANHISTAEMCRVFMGRPDAEFTFKPERFLRPAYREYLQRAAKVPKILLTSALNLIKNPLQISLSSELNNISQALPAGIFNNRRIHQFLENAFSFGGRTNDFHLLDNKLFVVAVDLDNGAAIRFGSPGYDDVPISRAVQASAALPGLYPPVKIKSRHYVDGALRRTLHASAALDQGIDLLLGINPLVPYEARPDTDDHSEAVTHLMQGGLPVILAQTFRALIQSRMKIGFDKYRNRYTDTDLLLLEPNADDDLMFFTNVFSYESRSSLCEHAYQITRNELRQRADELQAVLRPHNMQLDMDILADTERTILSSIASERPHFSPASRKLNHALNELETALKDLSS